MIQVNRYECFDINLHALLHVTHGESTSGDNNMADLAALRRIAGTFIGDLISSTLSMPQVPRVDAN